MKKMIFTLIAMLTITAQANAMSYEEARNEALFLTDKMAYELNLTDVQYEAAYEINLDYLMSVSNHRDIYGSYWDRRNLDLGHILSSWQWETFRRAAYFYRPLAWRAGRWHFSIYTRYPHRNHFYYDRPRHHQPNSHHRPQVSHHQRDNRQTASVSHHSGNPRGGNSGGSRSAGRREGRRY
jgi:hypothetical protein